MIFIPQLICTITPASSNLEETHNTLKFASRAKRVEIYASRNRVSLYTFMQYALEFDSYFRVVSSHSVNSSQFQIIDEKSLIKKYQKEISSLKEELDQLRRGMLAGISHEEILVLRQQVYLTYFQNC